jgi:hypothetical protein
MIRSCGLYKDKLLFSSKSIEYYKEDTVEYKITQNIKEENVIKKYLEEILNELRSLGKKGNKVKITNINTGIIDLYRSKREAARYLKTDPSSISGRSGLFRGLYKIEIIS